MVVQQQVAVLEQGDAFRDWLVGVLEARVENPLCRVQVYRIRPASHAVCRYEFLGEGHSVVGKFFGEPTGRTTAYNTEKAMQNEYRMLQRIAGLIDVPRPIAMRRDFHAALVTDYVPGVPLLALLGSEDGLYDPLASVARLQKRLHALTRQSCNLEREFAYFHSVLGQNRLDARRHDRFCELLSKWRDHPLLADMGGCLIHGDATPANYLFVGDRAYGVDFEHAWECGHPVHDPGIFCAEMKHLFAYRKGSARQAEPYIGHFLWHYSGGGEEFYRVTETFPFFLALGYLRIARLPIHPSHRECLIREAEACLTSGLTLTR
ncbi:hypothetical protein ASZ90_010643 [hydrocarbon metagenome]|uniref:Aminoglycoside phosphotransferase domain-containing protein n=1 Tax=hydrocarbon metagenome TaxID=938273 RepID=A0A0W8FFG5_9ZZZZ|nr:aminoglycoside phosphotransferase family protein [Methanomicrobiaceae archaeon]